MTVNTDLRNVKHWKNAFEITSTEEVKRVMQFSALSALGLGCALALVSKKAPAGFNSKIAFKYQKTAAAAAGIDFFARFCIGLQWMKQFASANVPLFTSMHEVNKMHFNHNMTTEEDTKRINEIAKSMGLRREIKVFMAYSIDQTSSLWTLSKSDSCALFLPGFEKDKSEFTERHEIAHLLHNHNGIELGMNVSAAITFAVLKTISLVSKGKLLGVDKWIPYTWYIASAYVSGHNEMEADRTAALSHLPVIEEGIRVLKRDMSDKRAVREGQLNVSEKGSIGWWVETLFFKATITPDGHVRNWWSLNYHPHSQKRIEALKKIQQTHPLGSNSTTRS